MNAAAATRLTALVAIACVLLPGCSSFSDEQFCKAHNADGRCTEWQIGPSPSQRAAFEQAVQARK